MFLLFGGKNDFNIQALNKQLLYKKINHHAVIIEENKIPSIQWDLNSDRLFINGKRIVPSAIFLRDDVFGSVTSDKTITYSWYSTLRSWALAHKTTAMFNKQYIGMNKSYNLSLAKQVGFNIPKTWITNETTALQQLKKEKNYIIKPVNGGEYTKELSTYLTSVKAKKEHHNSLAYLQNKLLQPEMRIFGIGESFYGFWVKSNMLDYRVDKNTKVIPCKAPLDLSRKLHKLMTILNLDFVAADFKTCPITKKLVFLEVNSGPMFGKFDLHSKGAITSAMIDWHLMQN